MAYGELSEEQSTIVRAVVFAWLADAPGPAFQPLRLGSGPVDHPNWPADVVRPEREIFRNLTPPQSDWLRTDRSQGPAWVISPSDRAIDEFGGEATGLEASLRDPDRRLGLILEAVVRAYCSDPSEPLHLAIMDQADAVRHSHWTLPIDAARRHDFEQLRSLDLVSMAPRGSDYAILPTAAGREAIDRPADLLEAEAEVADTPSRKARLLKLAAKLRTGEFAVNTAAGSVSGAIILALS